MRTKFTIVELNVEGSKPVYRDYLNIEHQTIREPWMS